MEAKSLRQSDHVSLCLYLCYVQVENLRSTSGQMSSQCHGLEAQVSSLQSQNATLQGQYSSLREQNANLQVLHLFFYDLYFLNYSGNRIRSTPQDRENVLTLSEVDLIHIQRHIVKYSQVSNSVIWRHVIVSLSVAVCLSEPVSTVLLICS